MTRYTSFVVRHPHLLAALVVVLFLPWIWMSALVPPWAILISLALVPLAALAALALIMRDLLRTTMRRGAVAGATIRPSGASARGFSSKSWSAWTRCSSAGRRPRT
jgi:hypothetical protein